MDYLDQARTHELLLALGEQLALSRSRVELVVVGGSALLAVGLTVRTTNCLEERGIFTVNDLLHSTRDDLLSISNFGEKTLEEVYKALEKFGFYRNARQKAAAAVAV